MERVFHYTTMDALLKLIESIKDSSDKNSFVFRATNIFFLNDPQEYIYGQKVLMDVLKEIEYDKDVKNEFRLSSFFSRHPNKSEDEWLKILRNSIIDNEESPYVISFSRNEDSLPMWLNYGDNGKGVSLAFAEYRSKFIGENYDPKSIDDMVVDIYDSLGTHDVSYKDFENKDNPLRKNLDYMYDYYLEKKNSIPQEELQELQIGMLRGLTIVHAPYIKTVYYSGENEARLAKSRNNKEKPYELKFRSNIKGHIVPYIDIEIPVKQLDYVRIGPLANKDLLRKAIEMIKKKYNLEFDIKESDINYRDY